ncbi:hypothetical protein ACPA9J_01050 [Pseudomonas aeruginosa]
MTETARHADYVLPAASQFEKAEATFFNLEFPRNAFHLRAPLFPARPGTCRKRRSTPACWKPWACSARKTTGRCAWP